MQILTWTRCTLFVNVTSVSPPFAGSLKYGTLTVTGFVPLTTRLSPVGPVAVERGELEAVRQRLLDRVVADRDDDRRAAVPRDHATSASGPVFAPSTEKWNVIFPL